MKNASLTACVDIGWLATPFNSTPGTVYGLGAVGDERMEIIDNINRLLGDDQKGTLQPGAKISIAASCFSIYAFDA